MKAVLVGILLTAALVANADFARAGLTDWWKSGSSSSKKSNTRTKKPFSGSKSAKGGGAFKLPNVVGNLSTSTKKAYTNTKAMLTPGKKKPEPKKLTGSRTKKSKPAASGKESTSMFGSLFSSKEPEPPKSVKEWMSLPRLDP